MCHRLCVICHQSNRFAHFTLTAATDDRDKADVTITATNQLIINAVKGDPNYGDDSDLYDAMGYVRRSARASGLSRGKTPVPAPAATSK